MGMLLAIASSFVAIPAVVWLHRHWPRGADWLAVGLPFCLTIYFSFLVPGLQSGPAQTAIPWIPTLGLELAFRADGLSLLFALLVCFVGVAVFSYSGGYFHGSPRLGRFYGLMFLFMGSMLGLVLADELILLSVFWELTTVSSFLLIGFHHEQEGSREAALQALLVTAAGGLAMLAGFLLLGMAGATFRLSELAGPHCPAVRLHAWYPAILGLILAGAFTKSAQVPFHFWLPRAMAAPTPVSAYLHSAAMVNGGIYLLARLHPVLAGTAAWSWVVIPVGAATMAIGSWLALQQDDLKAVLAYSTVSVLGMLVMLLGLGTEEAVKAMLIYLVGHALYKAGLFLTGGAASHAAGTRDLRQLSGLMWGLPLTALAACLAALAKAGLPPALSMIGKELVYTSNWSAGSPAAASRLLLPMVATGSNVFLVAVAWITGVGPYLGRRPVAPGRARQAHGRLQVRTLLWLSPLVLGLTNVALGLAPAGLTDYLLTPAAGEVTGSRVSFEPGFWHGFTPAFFMSIASLTGGVLVIWQRPLLRRLAGRWAWLGRRGPERLYHLGLAGFHRLAVLHTRVLQSGYQRVYLLLLLGPAALLIWGRILTGTGISFAFREEVSLYGAGLAGLIVAAVLLALFCSAALSAVLALGLAGYGIGLVYLLYGAPDLAITQFLVETVTVILFALIVYQLPSFKPLSPRSYRWRDGALSLFFGSVMSGLVLQTRTFELGEKVSTFYLATSVEEAHSHNVVNAIINDFRAFDTMGEVTVLTAAALGVYAVLKFKREQRESR